MSTHMPGFQSFFMPFAFFFVLARLAYSSIRVKTAKLLGLAPAIICV